MELSILENIAEEHELLYDEMKMAQKAKGETRKELFDHLKQKLVNHMDAEDEAIYHKLDDEFQTYTVDFLIHKSSYEHHELKEYLQRLTLMDMNSPEWEVMFDEFVQRAIRHCIDEEMELFQELKEDYGREELIEMGWNFINIRATLTGDPDKETTSYV